MLTKLNLGCGETKLDGFINVDFESTVDCDVACNFKKDNLPFDDNSIELVHMIHVIEHIEKKFWNHVFFEIRRVLKESGELRLAYPEWEVCAKNYLENVRNQRLFWEACLYGRQLYPGDYHVTPVQTPDLVHFLTLYGFCDIRSTPEPDGDHYTFLTCKKGNLPMMKEDVIRQEVFGGKMHV